MVNHSINRVTVYRLKLKTHQGFVLKDYDKVHEGTGKADGQSFKYWLYFLRQSARPAGWYKVFEALPLTLPNNKPPRTLIAGFILVVQVNFSFYGITGGVGHLHLGKAVEVEHRFGILLAEKILSVPELRGLIQKDTSGIVNRLDRVFRGSYNPRGELDNLRRVLTNVRGRLDKKNQHYGEIGKSIQAGNALTVNGAKSFDELFTFLFAVEKLWASKKKQLTIPQLAHIDKKFNGPLLSALETTLVEQLRNYKAGEQINLFLDNEEIGYLPDRIVEYQVLYGRQRSDGVETYEGVFEQVAAILQGIAAPADQVEAYKKMRVRVTFDDEVKDIRPLPFFVCGDVTYNNEVYFINNRLWYQADQDFLQRLDNELDNVQCCPPETLNLIEWDDGKYTGTGAEGRFNKDCAAQSTHLLLDCRTVKIPEERGGIEFCDLLDAQPTGVRLIHVKHATGAALRALFAQVFVSAKLYCDSDLFREHVHTADVNGAENLKAKDKQALAALKDRFRRHFQVVFAIFDATKAHTVPKGAKLTSQVLKGVLTPFAKVDLLERVHSIRSMGYDVAITRIKPYPGGK